MRNVYFNHDGNVDDLVSLLLLLQIPDINIIGVGVIGADSFLTPAVSASCKIVDLFGHGKEIEVAASDSRAAHAFPTNWRLSSFAVDALPILNETTTIQTSQAKQPAHLDLIEKVMNESEPTTLIMTGPLSDLARAIEVEPQIVAKIDKLYWMGGSIFTDGNVVDPESDGTAEWNAFFDPEAVKTVWDSNLDIQMVGLESTNEVPLTNELRSHWAQLRQHRALDFIGQCYAMIQSFEADSTYYLWDVLTTLSSCYPELISQEQLTSDVRTAGLAAGQTIQTDGGRSIDLVRKVDGDKFFELFDQLAINAD